MIEYGVFEYGGCIESGFYGDGGLTLAKERMGVQVDLNPDLADAYKVLAICPDHEEQPNNGCEECAEEVED